MIYFPQKGLVPNLVQEFLVPYLVNIVTTSPQFSPSSITPRTSLNQFQTFSKPVLTVYLFLTQNFTFLINDRTVFNFFKTVFQSPKFVSR